MSGNYRYKAWALECYSIESGAWLLRIDLFDLRLIEVHEWHNNNRIAAIDFHYIPGIFNSCNSMATISHPHKFTVYIVNWYHPAWLHTHFSQGHSCIPVCQWLHALTITIQSFILCYIARCRVIHPRILLVP